LIEKYERDLLADWHRWKDNIEMDLKEMSCEAVNWINL
jgi:hypothetical protein